MPCRRAATRCGRCLRHAGGMRQRHRLAGRPAPVPGIRDIGPIGQAAEAVDDQDTASQGTLAVPPTLLAVDKEPACCNVVRRRELLGSSVFIVIVHKVGCPVWSAR